MAATTSDAMSLCGVGWLSRGGGALVEAFGFPGSSAFRRKHPQSGALDSLGFPWILSSESRLFNELRGLKRGNSFSQLFSSALIGATTSECGLGDAEAPNCS
jgi:hypothetical protein